MLLERMFEKRSGSSDSEDGFNNILLNMFGGQKTASGETVNERNSLVQPDVFACVNILSDDIASILSFQFINGRRYPPAFNLLF
ncbi:hypothetical protein [Bacillus atrophaeus]|uniref:hypothetical protein n=1 Tax=Bacillus atrophaeus TaxID=1452 RepID=UPI001CB8F777|nr:hypothetical protein [Bacillus atrophaeus]MED1123426.1 hypothetical protein [Bacillus atrophaeus]